MASGASSWPNSKIMAVNAGGVFGFDGWKPGFLGGYHREGWPSNRGTAWCAGDQVGGGGVEDGS
jgi:hypothetical protein